MLLLQPFRGWCGVEYYGKDLEDRDHDSREAHHQKWNRKDRRMKKFEEGLELDKDYGKYEKIDVPDIEECRGATILHDFSMVSKLFRYF